jgi:hypothetical protein
MDRWEESFDAWTPSQPDPGAPARNPEREELQRLARELAAKRRAAQETSSAEVEALQRSLRESAAAVAARDVELARLRSQLQVANVPGRERALEAELAQARAERALAVAERERLEEREQAVRAVEKELAGLRVELERREAQLAQREAALRRRELVEAPPEAPSFSEGLAALAHAHTPAPD